MPPDEPNSEEALEELPQDHDTPFRPPDKLRRLTEESEVDKNIDGNLDDTHPVTDTNIEPEELYQEGLTGAAEANEPSQGNNVLSYEKPREDLQQPPQQR